MRLIALALGCALPGAAAAADIKVLSAAAVAPGLVKVAEQYRKETKNRLRVQYANPQQLERRVGAGESADVLIASPGLMNDQLRRNKIEADKHVFLGRVLGGKGVEIGFATIPEIRLFEAKGLRLVGPLPEQIQSTITYSAAVMT